MTFRSPIFRQPRQDFILNTFGEIGVILVAAQIFKRKHGDAFVDLFLAKFLESGIGAQRVPDRIEPKKGRRNGHWVRKTRPNRAFVTAG